MLYGSECWLLRSIAFIKMSVIEMKMLRWMGEIHRNIVFKKRKFTKRWVIWFINNSFINYHYTSHRVMRGMRINNYFVCNIMYNLFSKFF